MKKQSKSRKKNASPKRVPELTRRRILKAAHKEFTEVGLAGARVDSIAESADVNKRMLYHYFGNKEGLFQEMMRQSLQELSKADAGAPQSLAEEVIYWKDLLAANNDWIRLLLWEALAYKPRKIIGFKERRAFWQTGVDKIHHDQLANRRRSDVEPDLLQLYLFMLSSFPLILPQMTELITGQSPRDPKFLKRYDAFLLSFSRQVETAPEK